MNSLNPLDDPQSREADIALHAKVRHLHQEARDGMSEYLIDLHFTIFAEWWAEDDYDQSYQLEPGEVHLRLVRLGVAAEEEAIFSEIFDYDGSMSRLSELYDWESRDWEFKQEVLQACPYANSLGDLFSIEHITLQPWARGQGVGLRVIDLLLRNWQSGCTIAALAPYSEDDTTDPDQGVQKLSQHFQTLGFQSLPNSPLLIRPLETRGPNELEIDLPEFLLVPSIVAQEVENS